MAAVRRTLLRGLGPLVFLGLLAGPASAQVNLVQNYSFETLGQVGWTPVINAGGAQTTAQWLDSAVAATDGANGLTSNQSTLASQVLYQSVVLPVGGRFSIQVAAGCRCDSSARSTSDFCRVDITDTSGAAIAKSPVGGTLATTDHNVLQAIYRHDCRAGSLAQADTPIIDISSLAGQTVRVRVIVSNGGDGPVFIDLDNVRLLQTFDTAPTLSPWGMLIMASLLVVAAGLALHRRNTR